MATILFLSWLRVAKPDTATGYELDSIAACVVGGVSLQGCRGSILGAAAGCLLLQALRTQITMSGFPEVLDALPSKFWEKEPTPFIFYTKYRC